MDPRTFELRIDDAGNVAPGRGVLVAFVPASGDHPAVVAMGCDPRQTSGQPIHALAPAVIDGLVRELGDAVTAAVWTVIDNYGRFNEAVVIAGLPVEFRRFASGLSIDAFYKDVGAPAEAAIELLSAVIEKPSQTAITPSIAEFLDTVEAHGSLPAPGVIFNKLAAAAEDGDANRVARAIQPDPVIASSLINYANAARFAAGGKTASVPQAVTRLGTTFVKRVVFVAEMMTRYQQGHCPRFDYRGFWLNAIATGAAMRAVLPDFEIAEQRADDAFTTGLVASIGWLVVAETYPALMARYIEGIQAADPITKARLQREIFPCDICRVSERYLQHFEFPDDVQSAVAGHTDIDRHWYDALARAIRIGQGMQPFHCLAIPTTIPTPPACLAEWQRWQGFLAGA